MFQKRTVLKKNGPELLEWTDSHTRTGGGSWKNQSHCGICRFKLLQIEAIAGIEMQTVGS